MIDNYFQNVSLIISFPADYADSADSLFFVFLFSRFHYADSNR